MVVLCTGTVTISFRSLETQLSIIRINDPLSRGCNNFSDEVFQGVKGAGHDCIHGEPDEIPESGGGIVVWQQIHYHGSAAEELVHKLYQWLIQFHCRKSYRIYELADFLGHPWLVGEFQAQ